MAAKKPIVAIAYDFDGTLAPGNMQEREYIPGLGLDVNAFWGEVKDHAEAHDMDEILAYMELMLFHAKSKRKPILRESFVSFGRGLELFPGVESWFDRVSKYGKDRGVAVEHYVISSGLREMIEGTSIGERFDYIFASGFKYDQHDVAEWPALAVNYTNKAQYLFRINKGIANSWDNKQINKPMPEAERRVPFENIVFIGDGETDIPAMKMTMYQGGTALAVYEKNARGAKRKAEELLLQDRADAAVVADYSEGSAIESAVQAIIQRVAAQSAFRRAVIQKK